MFPDSPEFIRAIQEDRRDRLLAAADAHRARRESAPTEPSMQRVRAAAARLGGMLRKDRHNRKIERLMASWMQPDRTAATLLAACADIVDVKSGTVIAAERFTYLALQRDAGAPLVIEPGSRSVTVADAVTMLVLPAGNVDDVARAVPALDAALQKHRSESTATAPEPIAVERTDGCAEVRHRTHPRSTSSRSTTRHDQSPSTASSVS